MTDADTPAPAQPPRHAAPPRPRDEIARLGDEIYERDIRTQVEATHFGEVIAIDVVSGDYAVADTARSAAGALRDQRPGVDVWLMRVGYPTLRHFGGGSSRRTGGSREWSTSLMKRWSL